MAISQVHTVRRKRAQEPQATSNLRALLTAPPPRLWHSSASPAEDKKDHAHHQEHKEQKLRDSCRSGSYATESQYRCDQRND